MHISKIDLYHVRMPLIEPWHTAYGKQSETESLIVCLTSDGQEGWGECTPALQPLYNTEYASGAFALARDVFAPRLVGQPIDSGQALQDILGAFKGNEFAKSAFDGAWWDLHANQIRRPLWQVIGGNTDTVSVGSDLPVFATVDQLLERVDEAKSQGFPRIKLKFNRECGYDKIAAVRNAYPKVVMHVDCNSGFDLEDLPLFEKLDKLDLAMIEQPLAYDDLIDHASLQKRLQTPICLDESITSLARARKAIDIGACEWINIKTSRVGGLTNAIAIHDLCAERGVPVWIGGMLESAIGQGCSLALATLGNVQYPSDIFPSDRFYVKELAQPDIVLTDGCQVTAPSRPGHGFRPNRDLLMEAVVAHKMFS